MDVKIISFNCKVKINLKLYVHFLEIRIHLIYIFDLSSCMKIFIDLNKRSARIKTILI